jgi:hypothetical protein
VDLLIWGVVLLSISAAISIHSRYQEVGRMLLFFRETEAPIRPPDESLCESGPVD